MRQILGRCSTVVEVDMTTHVFLSDTDRIILLVDSVRPLVLLGRLATQFQGGSCQWILRHRLRAYYIGNLPSTTTSYAIMHE